MKKIKLLLMALAFIGFTMNVNAQCDYTISLEDDYGDGWNGGLVTVLVNGTPVLTDLTILAGGGPETHTFTVNAGDDVTTDYTAGSWGYENYYAIYDADMVMVAEDGAGGTEPTDILTGTITAACPTCLAPSALNVTGETDSEATLGWTAGGGETIWDIEYGTVPFTPTGTPTNEDVTNPFTLTGLTASTDYEYYVRADCGAGDESIWVGPFAFSTTAACPAPTDLASAGVTTTSIDLTWNGYSATNWDIEYGVSPYTATGTPTMNDVASNPTTIGSLTPGETYDFYVRADCGMDDTDVSTWTGPFTFTIPAPGGSCDVAFTVGVGVHAVDLPSGDQWYEFTAPGDGNVTVTSCGETVDTRLYIYTDCPAVTEIVNEDDNCASGAQEEATFPMTTGSTIYIMWGDNWSSTAHNFEILYAPFSTETDILTYTFPEATGPATIDNMAHTVDIEVGFGTDVTNLIAEFTLSTGANADIAAVPQVSTTTANDFTLPVTYTITAEDGTTTQDWIVTVTEAAVNTDTDILTYTFPEETGPAVIDDINHTIAIEISQCADITNLIAEFTLSFGANADIAAVPQVSMTTANDFTSPLVYTITAEDGTTTQDWTVTVTQIAAPAEVDCANAATMNINDAPYTNALCPSTPLYVAFTLDQEYENVVLTTDGSDFDTRLAYFATCADIVDDMTTSPASPTNNLGYDDDGGAGLQSMITETTLAAGTYIAVLYGYTTASGNVVFTVSGDVPTIPTLNWDATTFVEASANDGTIETVVNLNLTDETFATTGVLTGTEYTVANVPAGLTVEINATDANNATVTLTGAATAHADMDDVMDMEITFLDAAFTGGVAADVVDYSQTTLMVDFNDPYVVYDIVITEISYNPPETGTDSLEFVEIYNNDAVAVNLNGYYFANGFDYTFGAVTLNPGEYAVVAVNAAAMMNTFGVMAYEWTSGGLSNSGEDIVLFNPVGIMIDSVDYDDGGDWPNQADDQGPSLVFCDPSLDNNDGLNWTVSTTPQGQNADLDDIFASPGAEDDACIPVVIDIAIVYPDVVNYVCDFDGTDTIPVAVENVGTTVIPMNDSIFVYYQIDAGPVVEDTIILLGDMNPMDVIFWEFDSEEDLSAPGTYNFTMWCYYEFDVNTSNDTLIGTVESYDLVVDLGGVNDTITVTSYPHTLDAGTFMHDPIYMWWDMSTAQTFDVNADGWYGVFVQDTNGCWAEDSVYVWNETGIVVPNSSSISVYPNPNKGLFTFEYANGVAEDMTIEILNTQGQVILTQRYDNVAVLNDQIDIRQYADGVYYLKVRTETQNIIKKIVVQ